MGPYKKKQEMKKWTKHAFAQESDQEKKEESTLSTKKATKKKEKTKAVGFLVEIVFFLYFLLSWFLF